MISNRLLASVIVAVTLVASARASPFPESSAHATHGTRQLGPDVALKTYHAESTYEVSSYPALIESSIYWRIACRPSARAKNIPCGSTPPMICRTPQCPMSRLNSGSTRAMSPGGLVSLARPPTTLLFASSW